MAQFLPYFCRFQSNLTIFGYLFKRFFHSQKKCTYNLNCGSCICAWNSNSADGNPMVGVSGLLFYSRIVA